MEVVSVPNSLITSLMREGGGAGGQTRVFPQEHTGESVVLRVLQGVNGSVSMEKCSVWREAKVRGDVQSSDHSECGGRMRFRLSRAAAEKHGGDKE